MTQPIDNVLSRVEKVRKNGSGFMACCPVVAHGDKSPSLSIKESDYGNVLLHCFAGCTPQEIVGAMGLEMRDLYDQSFQPTNGNGRLAGLPSLRKSADRNGYSVTTWKPKPGHMDRVTANEIEQRLQAAADPVLGRRASEIEEEEIPWLWRSMFPLGMLSLIDGVEGIGKTWIILAIAASTTTGRGFYGMKPEEHLPPGVVILVAPEDSAASVLKVRLALMGADMTKVIIIEEPINLSTLAGVLSLKRACIEYNPTAIVFDPMNANVGGIDINQDNQVRAITSELKGIAEEYNCAVIMVRHIGKSKGQGNSRNAGLGSVAWRASARMSFIVGQNPENAAERAMASDKNNLLPEKPRSIGYRITNEGLCWTGESRLTVEQMLSFKAQETHHERSAREEAKVFLEDLLRGRPMDAMAVMKAAKGAGHTETTITRAKYDIGIKPRKVGLGPWEWSLPNTNPGLRICSGCGKSCPSVPSGLCLLCEEK